MLKRVSYAFYNISKKKLRIEDMIRERERKKSRFQIRAFFSSPFSQHNPKPVIKSSYRIFQVIWSIWEKQVFHWNFWVAFVIVTKRNWMKKKCSFGLCILHIEGKEGMNEQEQKTKTKTHFIHFFSLVWFSPECFWAVPTNGLLIGSFGSTIKNRISSPWHKHNCPWISNFCVWRQTKCERKEMIFFSTTNQMGQNQNQWNYLNLKSFCNNDSLGWEKLRWGHERPLTLGFVLLRRWIPPTLDAIQTTVKFCTDLDPYSEKVLIALFKS